MTWQVVRNTKGDMFPHAAYLGGRVKDALPVQCSKSPDFMEKSSSDAVAKANSITGKSISLGMLFPVYNLMRN